MGEGGDAGGERGEEEGGGESGGEEREKGEGGDESRGGEKRGETVRDDVVLKVGVNDFTKRLNMFACIQ